MKSLLMSCALLLMIFLARISHGYPGFGNRLHSRKDLNTLMAPIKVESVENDIVFGLGTSPIKERHKRLSDQRRAELETLMALSKMSGKQMNYSHSARHLDPAKIGRRRRSITVQNPQNQQLVLRHRGVSINEGGASYPLIS